MYSAGASVDGPSEACVRIAKAKALLAEAVAIDAAHRDRPFWIRRIKWALWFGETSANNSLSWRRSDQLYAKHLSNLLPGFKVETTFRESAFGDRIGLIQVSW